MNKKNINIENDTLALTALVSFNVDLFKLEEDVPKESVPFTSAVVSLSIDLKSSIKIDGFVIHNPAYYFFAEEETGLKDILDQLLEHNEDAMEFIQGYFGFIDDLAEQVVNGGLLTLLKQKNKALLRDSVGRLY